MNASKAKILGLVFALLLCVGLITVGCKQETKNAWVNTKSMPGQTFKSHIQTRRQQSNSTIVYLGSSDSSTNVKFGPKNVNFEFRNLK